MIDTSSLEALSKSLPKVPRELEGLLMMKTRLEDAIGPAAASLAQRGYIGCFPFAHIQGDEIVLRLRPGVPLERTRVAVAYWRFTEGFTISPDLKHFVAGRLAQLNTTDSPLIGQEKPRAALLRFAAEWGDPVSTASTERVLAAIPQARTLPDEQSRSAALWAAADPSEPLFQVLAGAWSHSGMELRAWVDEAITRFPDEEIVQKLYVSFHVMRRTGVDVSDVAWKVVMGDALFDATYNGIRPGPSFNVWTFAPLVHAAKHLEAQALGNLEPRRALSLEAARAFARAPNEYTGVEHLEAARALASKDPQLAYTHASNAAAFFVRATEKTPAASIVLCQEIAQAQGWEDLVRVLDWTLSELKG